MALLVGRFKAKAWIDVFGTRVAKAFGSVVTNLAKDNPDALVKIGSVPSWMISMILLLISIYMGRAFERLSATREVVGLREEEAAAAANRRGPDPMRSVQDVDYYDDPLRLQPSRAPTSSSTADERVWSV